MTSPLNGVGAEFGGGRSRRPPALALAADRAKRVTVFLNGTTDSGEAILVPDSWDGFLTKLTTHMGIPRVAAVYTLTGGRVHDLNVLRDDDVLFVSQGEPFLRPKAEIVGYLAASSPDIKDPSPRLGPLPERQLSIEWLSDPEVMSMIKQSLTMQSDIDASHSRDVSVNVAAGSSRPMALIGRNPLRIFSGKANYKLGQDIASHLGAELCGASITCFRDGEINIQVEDNVRNSDIFVIQSTCTTPDHSVNDALMELFLLVRTIKRASGRSVTAVVPYFGYARQDRKTKPRVPISASDVAMMLEAAGVDRLVSVDLHCGQIQGFFHRAPVDNLFASTVFVPYIASKELVNPVVVSPDAGGVTRAKQFRDGLTSEGIKSGIAMIIKQRAEASVVDQMNVVGNVSGRDCIIVDDICDTAGTLLKAAEELKLHGARKVYACITHPVFSGTALERIGRADIEMIVSDTIPACRPLPPNIDTASVAPLIAEAIRRIHLGDSVSSLFL